MGELLYSIPDITKINMGTTNNKKGGFLNLKPFASDYDGYDPFMDEWEGGESKNPIAYEWRKLVEDQGPYDFFITLTFRGDIYPGEMRLYTNDFLVRYNKRIYGRNYKTRDGFIEGFVFIEDHLSQKRGGRSHIHILITCTDKNDLRMHQSIFFSLAEAIMDGRNRQLCDMKNIDFQVYNDEGTINYCMKHLWGENGDGRLKIIGKDGID